MRSILLVYFFLFSITTFSQIIQDDFEGSGNITTWLGDDCNFDISLTNPYQEGINTSSTVLHYNDVGGLYANVRFDASSNFALSGNIFKLKIYIPSGGITGFQPNQISLKLQDKSLSFPWMTQSEIIKPLELDQWQEVSFDFQNDSYINLDGNSPAPVTRTDFNRVVIQVNGEGNTDNVIAYIDDFWYGENTVVSEDPVYDNLVWSDEFDVNGPLDSSKWHHQTQLPNGTSWYNGEVQHYTNRTDNSFVSDGVMKIVAKNETFTDQGVTKNYTSARLNSKFSFTYGRVEVRAKLPFGVGTWPAIWMLGQNINEDGAYWDNQGYDTTGWPACGEIDIMEHWGTNQNFVQSAMHTPSSSGATVNHGGQYIATASTEFHVYSLDWYLDRMVFKVDDVQHYVYEPASQNASTWPFNTNQYLLLNVAIQSNIDAGFTQSALEVDYVRVYQESTLSIDNTEIDNINIVFCPNPSEDILKIITKNTIRKISNVQFFDVNGKNIEVELKNATADYTSFDVSNLNSGMYILHVVFEDGFTLKKKIIKD